MRGAGVRGTSIAARKADLERIIDIAQSTHVDRGYGYEQIVRWEDNAVHVRPMFGGAAVRVPQAAIHRAACIETVTFEEWRTA